MKNVAMKQWGDFLGTRFLGEEARRTITNALASGESPVVLDFEGVRGVSHSFADECFGLLAADKGIETFKSVFRFSNLNDEIKTVIRFVVAERIAKRAA
jgi:hypothetical protein